MSDLPLLPDDACPLDPRGAGFLMGKLDEASGQIPVDRELMELLPEHLRYRFQMVPVRLEGNLLTVLMADPDNLVARDDVRLITGFDIQAEPARPELIRQALETFTIDPGVLEQVDVNFPFPLQEHQVRARLTGPFSHVTVRQRFANPYDRPIEAIYVFPLPAGAAVHEFRLRVADRVVEGRVQERKQARQTYQEGKAKGHRTALLEVTSDNVMTAVIGNLPPGEQVQVELVYAERLEQNQNETVFRYPLVVAPRWGSGGGPPRAEGRLADLSLEVELECAGVFPDFLACSQHAVKLQGRERLTVSLARTDELLDRDFVLRFRLEPEQSQALLLTHEEHFMLSVMPPVTSSGRVGRDVVVMLDRSGSMSGQKMDSAREAVKRFLSRLQVGDRFALMAFDDRAELFSGGQMAELRRLGEARAWLDQIQARGGTQILACLNLLKDYQPEPGRLLCCLVITDGQVGNEPQIYQSLVSSQVNARIFTMGIDTAVNDAFLRQLARLGRGSCELLTPGEDLDQALARLAQATGGAVATDLHLVDRGLNYLPDSLNPQPMPDLFAGQPVVLTGRKLSQGPAELTARLAEDGETWRVQLRPVASDNPALGILWARDRVATLADRLRLEPGRKAQLEAEIVGLALQYRLLTPWTSFVLVDSSSKVETARHTVEQPLAMPSEWAECCETVKDLSAQDFGPIDYDEANDEVSLDKLKELVDEAPIIRVVNLIISQAINDRATHIHIEPEPKSVRVRYRVDGVLHDVMSPPKHIHAAMVSRLKQMAGLDLADRRMPQSGKLLLNHDGAEYHVWLSTLPTVHGEKLVCALRREEVRALDSLGLQPEQLAELRQALTRPTGLILLVGPPRSGLSTTLRSLLGELQPGNLTLWDPEGLTPVAGVNQTAEHLCLLEFLSSLNGQDPDAVALSDCLTPESTPALMRLARTCLVVAPMRAHDPGEALALLCAWAPPGEVSRTVHAVVAHRLERRTCEGCQGKGCDACKMTGFFGQRALFEVVRLKDEVGYGHLTI